MSIARSVQLRLASGRVPYTRRRIGQFLFKSNHFRTNFLYIIRYTNILCPVHDPTRLPYDTAPATLHDPPAQNLGGATPPPPPLDPHAPFYQFNYHNNL